MFPAALARGQAHAILLVAPRPAPETLREERGQRDRAREPDEDRAEHRSPARREGGRTPRTQHARGEAGQRDREAEAEVVARTDIAAHEDERDARDGGDRAEDRGGPREHALVVAR